MTAKADSFFLVPDDSVLVVIDVQEKLTPAMPTQVYQQMRSATEMLVKAAALFGIPVLTTEQYPRGLGHTVPELSAACAAGVIEKTSFGCCGEPNFVAALKQTGRQTVVVTGMETHVCVYQTVLGLLSAGYRVHLVRDAICSRNEVDYQAGVANAARAGALVVSAEMVLFQWLGDARHECFRATSALVKARS